MLPLLKLAFLALSEKKIKENILLTLRYGLEKKNSSQTRAYWISRVRSHLQKYGACHRNHAEPSRWNSQCPMVQLSETQVNKRKISNVSENSLSHRASSMFKNYSMYFVRENVYERVSSYVSSVFRKSRRWGRKRRRRKRKQRNCTVTISRRLARNSRDGETEARHSEQAVDSFNVVTAQLARHRFAILRPTERRWKVRVDGERETKTEKERERETSRDFVRVRPSLGVPPAGRAFVKPAIIRANSLVNADKWGTNPIY